MRTTKTIPLKNTESFKENLLQWSQQYKSVVWLDSNNYNNTSTYEAILAVEEETYVKTQAHHAFDKLKAYQSEVNDWIFGYLTYDLKNDLEDLYSHNFDGLNFPELYFFQPKKIFLFKGNKLEIQYLYSVEKDIDNDIDTIRCYSKEEQGKKQSNNIKIKLRTHKDDYFKKVNQVLSHIQRGDIYEANFCQEFYVEDTEINPLDVYFKLNTISKAPFATFLRLHDNYLLSASPERYIKKEGLEITSQPIKGTAKRSLDREEDNDLKYNLSKDEKERSENIMIVDLVRNDLSQTAVKGSVLVKELCKVYTFEQVHQMISTVVSEVDIETHPVDIIKTTFPMGSMTGAPKISAMQIIEELEDAKRGLYSGAVGYITPENDFDFNVIIRSILYNAKKQYVSYSVGGAITAMSDPIKEYEECLIKAKAMREVLESETSNIQKTNPKIVN